MYTRNAGEFDLQQHITSPTRSTSKCKSVIGLIMSNVKNVNYSGCINYMVSDHCPVYIIKKRISTKIINKKVFTRSLKNYNTEDFSRRLQAVNFDGIGSMDNVNTIWEFVKTNIIQIADECYPFRWKTKRMDRPIWYKSYIRELGLAQDKLYSKYRKGNRKNDELYKQGVIKRREFIKACKEARQKFFKQQLQSCRNDQ